jgi:hypothetical protein
MTATEAAQLAWERLGKLVVKVNPIWIKEQPYAGKICNEFCGHEVNLPLRYLKRGSSEDWKRQIDLLESATGNRLKVDRDWPIWELEPAD